MDRIVVDDDTIVTEGNFRSRFPVDDPEAVYLLSLRMLIVWPFDADGFIVGEETYSAVTTPDFFTKVPIRGAPAIPRLHRGALAAWNRWESLVFPALAVDGGLISSR